MSFQKLQSSILGRCVGTLRFGWNRNITVCFAALHLEFDFPALSYRLKVFWKDLARSGSYL